MKNIIRRIIILVIVLGCLFLWRQKTVNKEHLLCEQSVERQIMELLKYKESIGDLKVSDFHIAGMNFGNFNLGNLKISELDIQHVGTEVTENHVGLFNRNYELSVSFMIKNHIFSFPVNCIIKGGEAELEIEKINK